VPELAEGAHARDTAHTAVTELAEDPVLNTLISTLPYRRPPLAPRLQMCAYFNRFLDPLAIITST